MPDRGGHLSKRTASGAVGSGYALYEARRIRTEQVTVTTDKLPPAVRSIRIVQITDVHAGLLFHESRLEGVLQAVRAAQPDILVSTGDLVDGRLSREDVYITPGPHGGNDRRSTGKGREICGDRQS